MIFQMLMSGLYTQHFENVLCFQWLNMCKHQQLTLKINFLEPPIRSFHFLFGWCITFWPWYLINAAFVRADYKSLLLGSVTKFESLISRWKLSLATWRIRGKKTTFFFSSFVLHSEPILFNGAADTWIFLAPCVVFL